MQVFLVMVLEVSKTSVGFKVMAEMMADQLSTRSQLLNPQFTAKVLCMVAFNCAYVGDGQKIFNDTLLLTNN
jgi:hypothetical protein